MEKANKVLKPIVIVMGVLIVAMIALTVVVKVTGGKNKGTVSVEGSGETEQGEVENTEEAIKEWSFDDISVTSGYEASSEPATEDKKSAMDDPAAYILENSQTTVLTDADLKDLTAEELYYAKNEIYARNGFVFEDATLNTYFTGKSWYTANADFTPDLLTETESTNYAFIENYATTNNLTYTP